MASPDKTPLERLSWLQRQWEEAEVVFVRESDLAELEADVVRLRQERDEAARLLERFTGYRTIAEARSALTPGG